MGPSWWERLISLVLTPAGGVIPLTRLDGRILGNDAPGALTLRLREAYWARHDEDSEAVAVPYD